MKKRKVSTSCCTIQYSMEKQTNINKGLKYKLFKLYILLGLQSNSEIFFLHIFYELLCCERLL